MPKSYTHTRKLRSRSPSRRLRKSKSRKPKKSTRKLRSKSRRKSPKKKSTRKPRSRRKYFKRMAALKRPREGDPVDKADWEDRNAHADYKFLTNEDIRELIKDLAVNKRELRNTFRRYFDEQNDYEEGLKIFFDGAEDIRIGEISQLETSLKSQLQVLRLLQVNDQRKMEKRRIKIKLKNLTELKYMHELLIQLRKEIETKKANISYLSEQIRTILKKRKVLQYMNT